jgi:hypothetical protein
MFVDDPQCGFYRSGVYHKEPNKARKRVGWSPVAIFRLGGHLTAVIGASRDARTESDRDRLNELWSYVAGNPISEDTYRAVAERGEPWPDRQETVPSIPVANSSATVPERNIVTLTADEVKEANDDGIDLIDAARAKIGMPPRHERISAQIDEDAKQLGKYAAIDSDEMASKARSLQQRFLDLRSEAEKQYNELNRPLLDEQKRIRGIWFPIRDKADEASNKLRSAMGVWEDTKRKAAKVAAERAAAGQEVKSNVPPPAAQIKGGSGRAAAVKVEKFVTSIDAEKVFAQFKDDERVIAFLTDLAQKAIRAGITVQGVTVEEKSIVR